MDTDRYKELARNLDRNDPLARFRSRFFHGDENLIYLDGNSLGRLPLQTADRLEKIVRIQWGERLIRSWNEHWLSLNRRIAAKIAELIGAHADEVMIGDSTSVNLYKLAFGALAAAGERKTIITDDLNFPSDLYILQGLVSRHFPQKQLRIMKSADGIGVDTGTVAAHLDADTALLTLSHVAYKSGYMYDMHEITRLAHRQNALVLWDLSHAAGAVPLDMHGSGADMAVGCTYKYLNGGPGSPAFLYVRKEIQKRVANPIQGWFGHSRPFDFSAGYVPPDTADKYAAGTPGILSLAAVETGVDLLLEAGMDEVRKKSLGLSVFFLDQLNEFAEEAGFIPGFPAESGKRGSHISLRHPEGYRISRALIAPQDIQVPVIPDFRPPDNIRLGFCPLYTSYADVYTAAERLKQIVSDKSYLRYRQRQDEVP